MGGEQSATEPRDSVLTRRHFVLQDERPGHLGEIHLPDLDPTLRCLLFTDGTVTRTLEVQALSPITVEVVAEAGVPAPEHVADHLGVPRGIESVQRRVAIGTDPAMPVMWAESHLIPHRLPPAFLDALGDTADGIGGSLQQVRLESRRDMLWFGLDVAPEWSNDRSRSGSTTLTRLYRVITESRPALLISESFAVQRREGIYRLDWPE